MPDASPKQRRTFGAFNFRELVMKSVNKKLQEAKEGQNPLSQSMKEKLQRINGFVQRRIVHDYPYTDDYIVGDVIGEGASGKVYNPMFVLAPSNVFFEHL